MSYKVTGKNIFAERPSISKLYIIIQVYKFIFRPLILLYRNLVCTGFPKKPCKGFHLEVPLECTSLPGKPCDGLNLEVPPECTLYKLTWETLLWLPP